MVKADCVDIRQGKNTPCRTNPLLDVASSDDELDVVE